MTKFDLTKDNLNDVINNPNENDIFVILTAVGNPNWIAENKDEAFKINVDATKKLIDEIKKFKSKIYFMSSVEVFDGSKEKFLRALNPIL